MGSASVGRHRADRAVHVPEVLLHLGSRGGVTGERGRELVQRHLDARGLPAVAELHRGVPRLRWTERDTPSASVIVPTRHNREMMTVLLESLKVTEYPSWELIVVDNGGRLEGPRGSGTPSTWTASRRGFSGGTNPSTTRR
ncbi:MAG: glycosyltransferase [Microthrixaceae bacterium]|nr:glycosyltransferase [Microthrixaceae bacterium]